MHCVVTPDASDLDDMVDRACRIAIEEGFAKPGDRIIITAGVPLRTPGATNMLRIAYVGSESGSVEQYGAPRHHERRAVRARAPSPWRRCRSP